MTTKNSLQDAPIKSLLIFLIILKFSNYYSKYRRQVVKQTKAITQQRCAACIIGVSFSLRL